MSRRTRALIRPEFGNVGGVDTGASYSRALQTFAAGVVAAAAPSSILQRADAYRGAAECHRRLGNLDLAAQTLRTAFGLFRSVGHNQSVAWTEWAFANLLRQKGKYVESSRILKRASQRFRDFKDERGLAYALAGIAENTRIVGDYTRATAEHQGVLRLFIRFDDARGIAWAYEGIAQMSRIDGRIDEAEALFGRAIELTSCIEDWRGLAYALKTRGELSMLRRRSSVAIDEISKAIRIFDEIELETGSAYARKSLGDAYESGGYLDEAQRAYVESLELFRHGHDLRGIAYVKSGLASVCRKRGRHQYAHRLLTEAHSAFSLLGVRYGESVTRRLLGSAA